MQQTFSNDSFLPEGTGKTEETSEAEYLMENSPMMNGMADGMYGGNIWDWIFDKTIGLPDEYVEAKYGGEYSQEFKNAQLAGNSIPILYGAAEAIVTMLPAANPIIETAQKSQESIGYRIDKFNLQFFGKKDLKQVTDAAKEIGINRKMFGNYIHEIKAELEMKANQNFSYKELIELAKELKNILD